VAVLGVLGGGKNFAYKKGPPVLEQAFGLG
jgi:hypothetical protein